MRIRSILTSTAFAAALISSSSIIPPAMAQKGVVSTPLTAWAVTKVDDNNGDYCAMARKFTSDSIMTFAQNTAQESSFALDFQRPVFRAGQSMSITLDPGAGQQRVYNVTPVSSSAVVVKLGRDDAFFNALDTTGFLRIEAGSQSYHFNVSDINAGQNRLDGCIAAMVMPAAGDEDVALTPAPVAAVPPAMAAPIPSADIAAMKQQMASLKAQNDDLAQKMASLQNKSASSQSQVHASGSEIETLKSQISSLHSENIRLKTDLGISQNKAANALAAAALPSDELKTLQAENLRLKAQIQTLNQSDMNIKSLQNQLSALKSENMRLKSQPVIGDEYEEKLAQLTSRIGELQYANKDLSQSLTEVRAKLDAQKASMGSSSETIASLQAEKRELQSQLKVQQVDRNAIEKMREQISQTEQENIALARKVSEIEGASLQEKASELQKLRSEKDQKNAQLEASIKSLSEDKVQQQSQLVEVGSAAAELESLKTINAELSRELETLRVSLRGQEALKESLAQLQRENETLQHALEQSQQGTGALASLQKENISLKAQIDAQTSEISKLEVFRAQVQDIDEKDARIAALEAEIKSAAMAHQAELEKLTGELNSMRQQYALLQDEMAAQSETQAQIMSSESERIELNDDGSKEASRQIDVLEQNLAKLSVENRELKNKLDAALDAMNFAEKIQSTQEREALSTQSTSLSEREEIVSAIEPAAGPLSTQSTWNSPVARATAKKSTGVAPIPERKDQSVSIKSSAGSRSLAPVTLIKPSSSAAAFVAPAALSDDVPTAQSSIESQENDNHEEQMAEVLEQLTPAAGGEESTLRAAAPEDPSMNSILMQPEASVPMPSQEDLTGLTEAQRQEAAVSQNVRAQGSLLEQAKAEARRNLIKMTDTPVSDGQPLEVTASENPYDDIEVVQPSDVSSGDDEVASTQGEEFNSQNIEASPLEAPDQADVAEGGVSDSVQSVSQNSFTFAELLEAAHITSASKVQTVNTNNAEENAFSWQEAGIYGTAEQRVIQSPELFDSLVKEYLERTQQRCPGEFAIVPTQSIGGELARADSYEVACVGSQVSAGASLLFFNKDGVFTVVAHEAPTDKLAQAIDQRDQVMRFIARGG